MNGCYQQSLTTNVRVIVPLPGDITSADALKKMAQTVKEETGYINLLIANAGITGPGLNDLKPHATLSDFVAHAWKSPIHQFNAVYELNCTAVFYTIIAFLELLDEGNKLSYHVKSQVIATASTAAYLRNPRAGYAYCSSKAALVSMIKCFSSYCVPWGIRFNAIAAGCEFAILSRLIFGDAMKLMDAVVFPSDISAPLLKPFKISKDKAITEVGAFARSYQPAERAGSADDMAGIILYLSSRAGSFVNGSVMLVDGGKVATMPATY